MPDFRIALGRNSKIFLAGMIYCGNAWAQATKLPDRPTDQGQRKGNRPTMPKFQMASALGPLPILLWLSLLYAGEQQHFWACRAKGKGKEVEHSRIPIRFRSMPRWFDFAGRLHLLRCDHRDHYRPRLAPSRMRNHLDVYDRSHAVLPKRTTSSSTQ
jgi:hypothetical protein